LLTPQVVAAPVLLEPLWLVEPLACAWGVQRHPNGGKVVW